MLIKRLQKVCLFLFLIFIPTQLGKHFWPDWSYVLGIRVDYLSPTLYFLDLIWIVLVALNFKKIKYKRFLKWGYFLFFLFVVLNILVAANKGVAIYRWLRVGQLIWTVFYLKQQKIEIKLMLKWVIPGWIIFESLLGISQITKGGSLNGWFYFLGERNFSFNSIGIAQMSVVGQGLIRAYGTFSHPNSLAGFILASLVLWLKYYFNFKTTKFGRIRWWIVTWLGLVAIIISGSRLIWFLTILVIASEIFLVNSLKDKKLLLGGIIVLIGVVIMTLSIVNVNYPLTNFLGGFDDQSFDKRMSLNLSALKMIKESFFLGKGLGNFTVVLPDFQKTNNYFWLQPVHNIFLLLISEIGILGVIFLGLGLINLFQNKRFLIADKIIVLVILLTGMWDHYWITLPQNWWLVTVILGLL